jgi:hypothetical protein
MDGLRLPTGSLRDIVTANAVPIVKIKPSSYTTLMANYMASAVGDDVVVAITDALGTDGKPISIPDSIQSAQSSIEADISSTVTDATEDILASITGAQESFESKINQKCPVDPLSSALTRRKKQ